MQWLRINLDKNAKVINTMATKLPTELTLSNVYWSPISSYYQSLYEIKKTDTQWIVMSSESTTYINEVIWRNNPVLIKLAIYDDNKLFQLIQENYFNLLIRELGYYRAEQFEKPYWQSVDPAYFVTKVPKFWKPIKDNLVGSHSFDNSTPLGCPTRLSSPSYVIYPGKWYTLIGSAYKISSTEKPEYKNGFFRMDIYSDKNKRLKTYVTQEMEELSGLQELTGAGLAPEDSSYGIVSFQIDGCDYLEKYFPNEIKLFESNNTVEIDSKEYPYFNSDVSRTFLWMPPL